MCVKYGTWLKRLNLRLKSSYFKLLGNFCLFHEMLLYHYDLGQNLLLVDVPSFMQTVIVYLCSIPVSKCKSPIYFVGLKDTA